MYVTQHALDCDAIELHSLHLDAGDFAASLAVLRADERQRAARLRNPVHRQRYVQGRAALRRILACHLGGAPQHVALRTLAGGKPVLARDCGLHFSLSHCEQRGMVAVCRNGEIGIDFELLRSLPNRDALISRHFSAVEQQQILVAPPEQRDRMFLQCWTRKEAWIKMHGGSITHGLATIDVGADNQTVATAPGTLFTFEPEPGVIVSIAAKLGPGAQPLLLRRNDSRSC